MPVPHNIIAFGNASIDNQIILDNKTKNLANNCRNILVNLLPQYSEKLLAQLDDTLFELSNKCETHSRQVIYFDAMREIRIQQAQIQNNFFQSLLKKYDQFWRYGPDDTDTTAKQTELQSASQFSLIQEDDLEESLAVANLIGRIEDQYQDLLYAIEKRFAYMLKDEGINLQNNPVAPSAICLSFQDALCNLHIEVPVKLAIYKLFAQVAGQQLGQLYQTISDTLSQAGILPKLAPKKHQHRTSTPNDAQSDDRIEANPPSPRKNKAKKPNNASKLFSTLQQLLNQGRESDDTTDDPEEELSPIEATELLNALTSIQQQPAIIEKATTAIEGAALKTSLHTQLKYPKDKILGEVTDDTIDIISLLFEIILDDKNLPDAMKALLGQLQIPILKVAILDKSFFSEKKHPARCLLNQLTQAAFTWSEAKENRQDALYLRIDAAIQRILSEFKRNISLFDEINQEFAAFFEQEQKTAQALEQRMQQISLGKEKLQIARNQVMHEINSRIKGQDLPPVITSLLMDAWKELLLLINLRQGQRSKAWKKSLVLMDKLLWSATPKQTPDEQQKLLKQIPSIHRQIKEGMLCISFDQCKMEQLLKELHICQMESLNPALEIHTASQQAADPASTSPPTTSDIIEEIEITDPQFDKAALGEEQADYIVFDIGTWFEITDEDGNINRAKLAWRSILDGSLILVNRQGIKVLETSATKLTQQIQDGTARMLSNLEAPLIDRALISMMNQLKTEHKKQA